MCYVQSKSDSNYSLFKEKQVEEQGRGVINLYNLSQDAATHNQTEFTTF